MWRLFSVSLANMSSLQLVEVCSVAGGGGGRKANTANSVNRHVRVFTVKKMGEANVHIICHSEHPGVEPFNCEPWQQKSPHAI
jgi:hypothetical protein